MPRSRFFLWASIAMLACVLFAFSPSFYFRGVTGRLDSSGSVDLPWHLYLHGVALTAWFLLPVLQAGLVAAGRTDLHRRVGVAGVGIALAAIATGLVTVVRFVPRFKAVPIPGVDITILTIGDIVSVGILFPTMVGVGLLRRNQPAVHSRWILLSSLVMWGPVLSRIAAIWELPVIALLVSPLTFIVALIIHDKRTLHRVHPATISATAFAIIGSLAPVLIVRTSAARAFVASLE